MLAGAIAGLAGALYGHTHRAGQQRRVPARHVAAPRDVRDHRRHRPPVGRRGRRRPLLALTEAAVVPARLRPRDRRCDRPLQHRAAAGRPRPGSSTTSARSARTAASVHAETPARPTCRGRRPHRRRRPTDDAARGRRTVGALRRAPSGRRRVAPRRTQRRSWGSSGRTAPASRRSSTRSPASSRGRTGRIAFDGHAVQTLPPHARARLGLGRTFQLVGLAKDLTVRENILLAQHTHADLRRRRRPPVHPSVDRSREASSASSPTRSSTGSASAAYADTPVRNLSGGQQRIVELAAVLATAPEVLMLDEPTAGLSPAAAENLAERLRELRDVHGRSIAPDRAQRSTRARPVRPRVRAQRRHAAGRGHAGEARRNPEVLGAYLGETVA